MNKKIIIICLLLVFSVIGGLYYIFCFSSNKTIKQFSFIPSDAQVVMTIDIKSNIQKTILSGEYKKLGNNKDGVKYINLVIDKIFTGFFFKKPLEKINITEDFFNNLSSDFSIVYFDLSSLILKKPVPSPGVLGVFKIENREKIEKFLKDIRNSYEFSEKSIENYSIFVSKEFSYVIKDDFILLSSSPDILLLSLKSYDGKNKNMEEEENFQYYKKTLSSDNLGFIYFNLNSIRERLYKEGLENTKIKDILDSFSIVATSMSVNIKGFSLNTIILPEKDIKSQVVKNFFLQKPKKPESLNFFPREKTDSFLLFTDSVEMMELLKVILSEFNPDIANKFNFIIENNLKLNLQRDIYDSLTGEIGAVVPIRTLNTILYGLFFKRTAVFEDTSIFIGVKKDSRLEGLLGGMDTIISIISAPPKYKGITIMNSPDGLFCYSFIDSFFVINGGNSHSQIERIVDIKENKEESFQAFYEDRDKKIFPDDITGLGYINTKKLSELIFSANNIQIPELWIVAKNDEKSFKILTYIPFSGGK